MRIVDVRERLIPLSRYADASLAWSELTTSIVAIETDVIRDGKPVIGYGYASVGRYGQGGLIRERFAPRLLRAAPGLLTNERGELDPLLAWSVMMRGEKLGGHGERCVAVGALDMAIWDAAAKIAGLPLHQYLAGYLDLAVSASPRVRLYASGGYLYPTRDLFRLSEEIRQLADLGYGQIKIKIGQTDFAHDRQRIDVAARLISGPENLAVDAMNAYDPVQSVEVAMALAPLGLRWFEDVCDPLDFATQARLSELYAPALASGEALFSLAEAKLLEAHGGVRADRDILVFDPVHCYGLCGYLQIVRFFTSRGWSARSFWPHGGQLFALHIAAALGLGGGEITPLAFHPFNGLFDGAQLVDGAVSLPDLAGIGFESAGPIWSILRSIR